MSCEHTHETLRALQGLSLSAKTFESRQRIEEWVKHWGQDKVYVAFSGGKDSVVLLDLVRRSFPGIPAVFCNTRQEFPEVIRFVRTVPNVTWVKPKLTFPQVIEKYGYPFPSKEQACAVSRYRNTKSEQQRQYRLNGYPNGKKGMISAKWRFLIDAPFKVSEKCCNALKKEPFTRYARTFGRPASIVGIMVEESNMRKRVYLKEGCNAFDNKEPQSRPLMFWTEADVWEYIRQRNLPVCDIYRLGYKRTGCAFCLFGINYDGDENRFQLMAKTHPKLHRHCMEKLGLRAVLKFANIPTGEVQ
jgi:3'-phosphoadenosine 5'-phosphosulfate sulfotransferase (PAPS reductase)/FAD synthetase